MKNLHIACFAFCLFGLFACSKNDHQTFPTPQTDNSQYLQQFQTPDVLFAFLEVAQDDQTTTGWLLDNNGLIARIPATQLSLDPLSGEISKAQIKTLRELAQPSGKTIPLDELGEYYHKTADLFNRPFIAENPDAQAATTAYFLAFDLYFEATECGSGPHAGAPPSELQYTQILLKAEGARNGQIQSEAAREILTWLRQIGAGL